VDVVALIGRIVFVVLFFGSAFGHLTQTAALAGYVFLLPTAFLMHAFWKETDAQAKQMEMIQFQKDLALGGASLLIFAFWAKFGDDLGITITDPLFG
jgi:putative oxidoreductase